MLLLLLLLLRQVMLRPMGRFPAQQAGLHHASADRLLPGGKDLMAPWNMHRHLSTMKGRLRTILAHRRLQQGLPLRSSQPLSLPSSWALAISGELASLDRPPGRIMQATQQRCIARWIPFQRAMETRTSMNLQQAWQTTWLMQQPVGRAEKGAQSAGRARSVINQARATAQTWRCRV